MRFAMLALSVTCLFCSLASEARLSSAGYWELQPDGDGQIAVRIEGLAIPKTPGKRVANLYLYGDWYSDDVTFEIIQLSGAQKHKLETVAQTASVPEDRTGAGIEKLEIVPTDRKPRPPGVPEVTSQVGPFFTRIADWSPKKLRQGDARRQSIFSEIAFSLGLLPWGESGAELEKFRRQTLPFDEKLEIAMDEDRLGTLAVAIDRTGPGENENFPLGLAIKTRYRVRLDSAFRESIASIKQSEFRHMCCGETANFSYAKAFLIAGGDEEELKLQFPHAAKAAGGVVVY